MKLICGSFTFDSKGLDLWVKSSIYFLIAGASCKFFWVLRQ